MSDISGSVPVLLTDLLDPGDLVEFKEFISYPFPSCVGLSPDESDEHLNLSLRKLLLTSPSNGVSQAHAKAVKLGLETDSKLSTIILRAYAYQTTLWGIFLFLVTVSANMLIISLGLSIDKLLLGMISLCF